ncbi:MAG: rane protein [Sphingomonadales bacterium]|nr:rane protein [Sphingomonadales bacterium]
MIILALVIGIIAGLRSMMAPAAIAWAAYSGRLGLDGTWLAFLGYRFTPWIVSLLTVGELITDQLPSTPSRRVPVQFGGRLLTGGVSGAAIGVSAGSWIMGLLLGLVGAAIGTLGGAAVRGRMAAAFGSDRPAALIEDGVAMLAALAVVLAL